METALDPTALRVIICKAAHTGNINRIKVLLNMAPSECVDRCLNSEMSENVPLVIASRYGYDAVVRLLLEMKADPSVTGVVKFDGETIFGTPPLWAAAAAGHMNVVRILVEEGNAQINQPTSTNSTPLRGACYDGHLEIVDYLIEKGANLEIPNRHGHTSLMISAFRNKIDVVKSLLKAGANVNARTLKGNTALHDASEGGNKEIVHLLLEAGASLQPDESGLCPLLTSAICGHENIVDYLLPFCKSALTQRDTLKLLGATLIDKKSDIFNGVNYWQRALKIPVPEEAREQLEEMIAKREALGVYDQLLEPHSLEELTVIEHDIEHIRMLSLVMRERILGGAHPEVHYYLRYRGALLCDEGQLDRCYELWMRALFLQQRNLEPLHISTLSTLIAFIETFGMALDDFIINQQERDPFITPENIREVYEKVLLELERVYEWGDKPFTSECCEEEHDHSPQADTRRLFLIALQLFLQLYRLDTAKRHNATVTQETKQMQGNAASSPSNHPIDLTQLIEMAGKLHVPLLHIALEEHDRIENHRFPNKHVVEGLLNAGINPNVLDESGCSPLHVLLRSNNCRASIAHLLLDRGCSLFARNSSNLTAWDIIRRRRLATYHEICLGRYIKLRSVAANAVSRSYDVSVLGDSIPHDLHEFLSYH